MSLRKAASHILEKAIGNAYPDILSLSLHSNKQKMYSVSRLDTSCLPVSDGYVSDNQYCIPSAAA